jgi:class 3 adenylate cyclase
VKHTGDGIVATFPSVVAAVQAGITIQREMAGAEV